MILTCWRCWELLKIHKPISPAFRMYDFVKCDNYRCRWHEYITGAKISPPMSRQQKALVKSSVYISHGTRFLEISYHFHWYILSLRWKINMIGGFHRFIHCLYCRPHIRYFNYRGIHFSSRIFCVAIARAATFSAPRIAEYCRLNFQMCAKLHILHGIVAYMISRDILPFELENVISVDFLQRHEFTFMFIYFVIAHAPELSPCRRWWPPRSALILMAASRERFGRWYASADILALKEASFFRFLYLKNISR